MKRIFNIFISCTLLISFLGGAGVLTSSCTPEDQPGEQILKYILRLYVGTGIFSVPILFF
jgi:hypothetical protein